MIIPSFFLSGIAALLLLVVMRKYDSFREDTRVFYRFLIGGLIVMLVLPLAVVLMAFIMARAA